MHVAKTCPACKVTVIDLDGEYQNNDILQMTFCSFECSSNATLADLGNLLSKHAKEDIYTELTAKDQDRAFLWEKNNVKTN